MAGVTVKVGKLSRRLGVGITAKGLKVLTRRPNPPGQHGARRRKLSVYGTQLLEKQKLRAFYGLRETQFRNLFEKAVRMPGATGDNLLQLLERRLDNVVYRLGLANTRAQSRQLVNHRHFEVDGVPTDIPSYTVKPGQVITVRANKRESAYFKNVQANRRPALPEWLAETDQPLSYRVVSVPSPDNAESAVQVQLIVEFYSR